MIKIICVGKIKESFYRDAIMEYKKRLDKYHKVEIIEVMDSNINQEKELILKKIRERDYIITMEIDGKELDSIEFADFIDKSLIRNSNITFIIGGSNGLHDDIKKLSIIVGVIVVAFGLVYGLTVGATKLGLFEPHYTKPEAADAVISYEKINSGNENNGIGNSNNNKGEANSKNRKYARWPRRKQRCKQRCKQR